MIASLLFAFIWDVYRLDEILQPDAITTISWIFKEAIVLALITILLVIIGGFLEFRRGKNRRLPLFLAARIGASFLYILLISMVIQDSHRNRYTPAKTARYAYEDVRIPLPGGDMLAGSLTCPKGRKGKIPAVVLITGSSPHDRDNASPGSPRMVYRPFRQIADRLSANGIAVLRMDDRGVGESVGGDIRDMATDERAKDIEECVAYLRCRPEIDASRIGLIGLSEGVSISHMIASKDIRIKALVFLSGIGSPGKDVLKYQIEQGVLSEDQLAALLKEDKNTRFLYDFDPLITVKQIRQPVLIIHGKKDRYVRFADADRLKNLLIQSGNNNVTLRILEGYDHTLLKEEADGSIRSARIPDEVLTLISDWLVKEI